MRKSFIAAGAAALTLGAAGVAYAQAVDPAPTLTVGVSPSKVGTKSKPAAAKLTIKVVNNEASKTTMKTLTINFPKNVVVGTKGLKACTKSDTQILDETAAKACKGSIAGKGEAHARLAPNTQNVLIEFEVVPIVGKNEILFALAARDVNSNKLIAGGTKAVLHGKIAKASGGFGTKVTIRIPDGTKGDEPNLQQPATGVYSALSDLSATLSAKKGSAALISTVGCSGGKQAFQVKLDYAPNPAPPSKSSATADGTATCKK